MIMINDSTTFRLACVACGGEVALDGAVDGYVAGEKFEIFSCATCSTKMSHPHVSGSHVYDLIYKNRITAPGYARYYQYSNDVLSRTKPLSFLMRSESMYYGVGKTILAELPPQGSVLDVGCGLGYFTYALVKEGYDATGIDISEEAIHNARQAYGDFFVCDDFFAYHPKSKYDVVCMLELIEHVDNPHAYIAHARTLLKPGGRLIITTPNRSWYSPEDIWNTDLPPVHLTWFSEKGIKALFSTHGFISNVFDYGWYNVRFGTLSKPAKAPAVRSPIFDKEGKMLAPAYYKSSLRIFTERFHLYTFLKGSSNILGKVRDIAYVLLHPSHLSLRQSGTLCVSAHLRD